MIYKSGDWFRIYAGESLMRTYAVLYSIMLLNLLGPNILHLTSMINDIIFSILNQQNNNKKIFIYLPLVW